jgi:enterochelin esterase-like enzyme
MMPFSRSHRTDAFAAALLVFIVWFGTAAAQNQPEPTPNDTLTSVRVQPDGRVRFSLYAPKASAVTLGGTDIPNPGPAAVMTRREDGVWETKVGPVPAGAYRYCFIVDGVSVIDPRNPATSESNANTWSLFRVPGADFMETLDVPHGAVSEVFYHSKSLGRVRRMHVYTPPGYEKGKGAYPVFYLLHGAYDCDDSWTSVGQAGFILDNLIAEKKAVPMVVIMPAGHTGPFRFGSAGGGTSRPSVDDFIRDFTEDIIPLVESRYRVKTDRAHRAIAGLSMGGAHTLAIGFSALDRFAWLGVFSSGAFSTSPGAFGRQEGPTWEENHRAALDDPSLKKGLRLVWFATGKDDFLLQISRDTVDMLKKHGFDVEYSETAGGHTWLNWREYLNEFSQRLFK